MGERLHACEQCRRYFPYEKLTGWGTNDAIVCRACWVPTRCDACGYDSDGEYDLEQRADWPGVRSWDGGYRAPWVCTRCLNAAAFVENWKPKFDAAPITLNWTAFELCFPVQARALVREHHGYERGMGELVFAVWGDTSKYPIGVNYRQHPLADPW